jgi:hypothetical protein
VDGKVVLTATVKNNDTAPLNATMTSDSGTDPSLRPTQEKPPHTHLLHGQRPFLQVTVTKLAPAKGPLRRYLLEGSFEPERALPTTLDKSYVNANMIVACS